MGFISPRLPQFNSEQCHRQSRIIKHHTSSSSIEISQVQSNADITSLADLRYQEWIIKDGDESLVNNRVPSRTSFRLATAEIYQERSVDGATVFLARHHNPNDAVVVVGAAELSPIETRGCIYCSAQDANAANLLMAMYVTDVVTSSSHRRLGIGTQLMNGLQVHACSLGCKFLFLHVKYDNVAAIDFYHRLGYMDVDCSEIVDDSGVSLLSIANEGIRIAPITTNSTAQTTAPDGQIDASKSIIVRTNQLAINAGTVGQLLMVKQLKSADDGVIQVDKHGLKIDKAAAGFGKGAGRRSRKNKVKTKR